MWPNPQFPTDLVTFTEEILNGKPHFFCTVSHTRTWMKLSRFKRLSKDETTSTGETFFDMAWILHLVKCIELSQDDNYETQHGFSRILIG